MLGCHTHVTVGLGVIVGSLGEETTMLTVGKGAEAMAFAAPRQIGTGGKKSGYSPAQGLRERVERSDFLHRTTYDRTWRCGLGRVWLSSARPCTFTMLAASRLLLRESQSVLVIPKERHCDTTVCCGLDEASGSLWPSSFSCTSNRRLGHHSLYVQRELPSHPPVCPVA